MSQQLTNSQDGLNYSLFPTSAPKVPRFDGSDIDQERDGARLTHQLDRIRDLMADGQCRTLGEIAHIVSAPESSVSAQLRNLRKPRFGGYTVERKHIGCGLWRYRVAGLKPGERA